MTTPAYLNAGTRSSTGGATSVAPALPASRTNGNILVAIVGVKSNAALSLSGAGWAPLIAQTNSGTGWTGRIWWRVVDGTEAAPTISWSGSVAAFGQIVQFTRANFDTAAPWGNISAVNSGTGATHSSAAITTTRANSLVVYFDFAAANTAIAQPTSWTERLDGGSATGATRNANGDRTIASPGGSSGAISVTGAAAAWLQVQAELLEPVQTLSGAGTSAGSAAAAAVGADAAAGTPTPLVYGSYLWSGSVSALTYTFPNMAIGPAASDRWVIAAFGIHQRYSGGLTSVTIGGVAATKLYGEPTLAGSGTRFEFWKALVPTGTTANIAIVSSGDMWDGAGATYYCSGEPTYFDAELDLTFTGTTFSVSIDVPEGGALLAHASNDDDGAISSWVGVTADASDDPFQSYFGSASQLNAQTGRTVSFTATAPATADNFYGLAVLSVSIPMTGGGGSTVSGAGASAGAATATASGASTRASSGTITGAATASAPGAATTAAGGASAGGGAASATGSSILSAVASAVGSATANATGDMAGTIASGAGTAAGATTAQATGAATGAGVASSAGIGSASATGASTRAAAGAGTGVATASAAGQSTAASVGTATGGSAANGSSAAGTVVSGVGASVGVASVSGVAAQIIARAVAAAGAAVAQAGGGQTIARAGSASGVASVSGITAQIIARAVQAAGVAAADAVGGFDFTPGQPGRIAYPSASANGGALGASATGGTIVTPRNGGVLGASERSGRLLGGPNGGTLIEG